jgi:O-antigen/teichoic acid export membrane protein
MFAAALMSIIFLLGIDVWSPVMSYMGTSYKWWFSFIAAVMVWCIFALQDSVLTGLRQAIWVPFENTAYSIFKIILLVGLAVHFRGEGIFISWVIPVIISLIPVNLLIFLKLIPLHVQASQPQLHPISLREIVKFASGNYLGSLFFWTSASVLPIIVTNQAGASANAYFYPAWAIASGLQFIASNLSVSLTVEVSIDQTKLIAYSRRVLVQTAAILAPIVILILFGARLILSAFGTVYAAEGTTVLMLLALGTLPNILVALSISLARIQNRSLLVMLIQGTLCILLLGLSLILLPQIGINGVGLAWLISQSLVAVFLAITFLRPILRNQPPVTKLP